MYREGGNYSTKGEILVGFLLFSIAQAAGEIKGPRSGAAAVLTDLSRISQGLQGE